MKNRKLVLCALVVMVLVVAMLVIISATAEAKVPSFKNGVYVYDAAQVVESAEERYINDMFMQLEAKSGVKFVAITVKDLHGEEISEYADRIFEAHEMNRQSSGIFVFSKKDRIATVKTTAALEQILTEKDVKNIFRRYFTPNIEKKEYEEAVCGPVKSILGWISSGYNVDITTIKFTTSYEGNAFIDFLIIMASIAILMGGILYINNSKRKKEDSN